MKVNLLRQLLWIWVQLLVICCAACVVIFVSGLYATHIVGWLRIGGQLVWPTLDNVGFISLCALPGGFFLGTVMTWEIWTGR
jgi:hypothetical protein